ncbi:polycomb group protein Psc [Lucilia cuprina]|uniref:polycomb group protein Psc n=1 Tax=Lucilia cuprina TaxID=7375 RepID=UPI001F05ECD6|nr:polycomb group protein Psc [Lucilia cuprina]
MSPVPLPVTNSASKTQTTATTKVAEATTTISTLPVKLKTATATNMANSNTTYKQMEQQNKNTSNNNNNAAAVTNVNKTKTQNRQQLKEMSSSASSTSTSSSYSCSSSSSSNAKNVITSQCDSSSSNSNNDNKSIKNESNQSCDTVIKTELESNDQQHHQLANDNDGQDEMENNDLQLSAMRQRPILMSSVNSHIICSLCFGYLIDATTIVECLHSFCHSCLIKHLRTEQYCPRCEMMINTAKPNIKPDTTLQAIVYKLVPGLYEKELMRKRAFYKDRPEEAALATPEQRGDDTEHLIFSPSDYMSISLEYADIDEHMKSNAEYSELLKPRYLQCPAMCTVAHLKKLVYGKFEINCNRFTIDIMYKVKTIVLLDHYTLMDVAYIYTWKRDAPMRFYFRVKQSPKPLIRVKKNLLTQPKKEIVPVVEEPKLHSQAMCIVHEPTPSLAASVSSNKILEPEEIKQENESEVSSTTEIPPPSVPEQKQFEIVQPQSPSISSHETSLTDKLKITLVNKAVKDKSSYSDVNSPARVKTMKEKKDNHKTSPSTSSQKDERKVENIKLKIDLSKQNSVTIINMSDPERKEIVKPVKPEKEWKVKTKKDKDSSPKSSPKSSPHSERKSKTPSPLTVPPLTIKAERISPLAKTNLPSPLEEEDKKSQFLKSFALTPTKNIKTEKLETKPSKTSLKEFTHSIVNKTIAKDPLQISSSSKRKSKEPVKAVVKKPKLSPPLATEDFKIKLPPIVNAKPASPSTNKTLMPPPPAVTAMKPPTALPKKLQKSQQSKVTAAPPGSLTPHPMHGGNTGIQLAAPGSRTPIAKRFQPILPKTPRINPFANIPSDVNKILKDAGTEIKTIPKEPVSSKVYGPKTDAAPVMGPPSMPAPPAKTSNPTNAASNARNNANVSSSSSSAKPGAGSKNNSYLNLALFNASKSKGNEVPPGCRTPMYTPNSPIYSPSSPQYVPNYNIPTMPTYKYTPKPSNAGSSYLQNVLGSNNQMSSLFPSPPVKKDTNSSGSNGNNNPTNLTNNRSEPQAPKRVYSFARSPSPVEDPPEKQLKVKSLLNSCNINIPSSLSITITREDGETSCNGATYPKHKSPVNNYIEILKLPDQPADNTDSKRLSPPIQNTNNSLFPNPPVRRVATPPLNTVKQNNNSPQQNGNNTKQSPPATVPQNLVNHKTSSNNMPPNMNLMTKNQNVSNKSPVAATNNKSPANTQKSPINATDKKTPSPEKRPNPSLTEQKSPNGGDNSASKKFRHILPRQIAAINTQPDVNPTKTTNNAGNVIGTYSSPTGVNVKIHSNNKKVQPCKKSPGAHAAGATNKQQNQAQNAAHNGLKAPTKSPQTSKNNNSKTTSPPVLNANNASKLSPTPNMPTLPPTLPPGLTHPMQSMLPPHLAAAAACQNAAAGQAELSKLLKENLLRAQVQAAVANQSNMFYPYAANAAAAAQLGQFNPTMYNYQQAYIMDQLSRMQRAGNEAFSEYMQKLKNSMDANKPPAEMLTQPQQQQQHPTKPMQNTKKLSSPKSLTGPNNPPNSVSTTAPHSAITNPTKDFQAAKTK